MENSKEFVKMYKSEAKRANHISTVMESVFRESKTIETTYMEIPICEILNKYFFISLL